MSNFASEWPSLVDSPQPQECRFRQSPHWNVDHGKLQIITQCYSSYLMRPNSSEEYSLVVNSNQDMWWMRHWVYSPFAVMISTLGLANWTTSPYHISYSKLWTPPISWTFTVFAGQIVLLIPYCWPEAEQLIWGRDNTRSWLPRPPSPLGFGSWLCD